MAVSIGNLSLIVSANISPLTGALNKASGGISGFARGITGTFAGISGGILSGLGQIGHAIHGVRAIINLIDDTILAPVKAAARFEVVVASMSGMLGSMEKAQKVAQDIFSFAGSTPFTATELLDASKKMLAVGTSVNQVSDTIKVLGDVSAGSGKDLNELTVLFSQVRSAGRLLGQDMLQFNQANIPLSTALAKRFNISELALRKMVEAGKVGFRDVAEEIQKMTEAGGLFHKQMELRSNTLTGKWAKVANEFAQGMIAIGNSMAENLHLKELLNDVLILGQAFRGWMEEGGLQRTWEWLSSAVTTVGGKFLDFVDTLKLVGSAAVRYVGAPMMKVLGDVTTALGMVVRAASGLPGMGDTTKTADWIEASGARIIDLAKAQAQFAESLKTTKIGDSRAQFAAGVQSFNDWMAGMRAAAEAKKPGFWGSLFESVRGSIAAGAGFSAESGIAKLGKTGAAEFGSKEAESIIARSQGAGNKTIKDTLDRANKLAERANKLLEENNRLAKTASDIIVTF